MMVSVSFPPCEMQLPEASCGASRTDLRRSPTCLRSHELRRCRLAISLCSKLQSTPPNAGKPGKGEWRMSVVSLPSSCIPLFLRSGSLTADELNLIEQRPLDSGHGLWPRAFARDGVLRKGTSSRDRPEPNAAKSKGDEVSAPGSARGDPLFTKALLRRKGSSENVM
jgi:hypothetical protein